MPFWEKKSWEDLYDEDYAARTDRLNRITAAKLWFQLAGFFVLIAVLIGIAAAMFGRTMLEKLLISLVSPIGVVWLLLLFQAYLAVIFRQSIFAMLCFAGWLTITIFGNSYISNGLVYRLERDHLNTVLEELPEMDVVFLLGGGTKTNLQRKAQVDSSGDRVVAAARLYHLGKAKMIVCTGEQSFRVSPADLDPREEAAQILAGLKVPVDAVAMIRGPNTTEEMKNAALFLQQQKITDAKIGILTSAWHLDRAGRLAGDNGLDPVLIPSDFQSGYFVNGPNVVVPSADNLAVSARCVKEFLAGLIGR